MDLLRRALLGSGALPADVRVAITAEEALVVEEGLTGSVTRRRVRAPGQYTWLGWDVVAGAVAVTDRRLVVWAGRFKHIDVPHRHPLRAEIAVTADRPGRVCFTYGAGAGHPSVSGRVEVRLRTARAAEITELARRLAG